MQDHREVQHPNMRRSICKHRHAGLGTNDQAKNTATKMDFWAFYKIMKLIDRYISFSLLIYRGFREFQRKRKLDTENDSRNEF